VPGIWRTWVLVVFLLSAAALAAEIESICPYRKLEPIPVFTAFARVEGLGEREPVALVVKKATRDPELHAARKSDKVEGISDNRQVYPGFVALSALGHLDRADADRWKISADMPHGFAYGAKVSAVSSTDKLLLIDSHTGRLIETIHDPAFQSLHTVEFRPGDPNRVLLTSSGSNRVLEYDLQSHRIVWSWDADQHGFNSNNWGAIFVPKGSPIPQGPGVRRLTYREAKALAQTGTSIPQGEKWYVEYEPQDRSGPIGQERWARTAYPNWAGYGHNPNEILVTIYSTGDVLKIDRTTGQPEVLRSGLYRPHGVVAFDGGFVISDSRHGRVELLDKDYHLESVFDFSSFPFEKGPNDLGWEWIQHTNPIGHGLLATIDSRRSKVYVWDPAKRIYSEYPLNTAWEVQAITQAPLLR
jgi:hypothetical protein